MSILIRAILYSSAAPNSSPARRSAVRSWFPPCCPRGLGRFHPFHPACGITPAGRLGRSPGPRCVSCCRREFSGGEFLRWTAALSEMRSYFAVPADFRCHALRQLADAATAQIQHNPHFLLLEEHREAEEGHTQYLSVFLFGRTADGCPTTMRQTLYHALNRDLSAALPSPLASTLCHLGQPVRVPLGSGKDAGALRICADARLVSGHWTQRGTDVPDPYRRQIATVLAKTSLLAQHFELVSRLEIN